MGNIARDRRNLARVKALGWRAFVVWECEINDARLRKLARLIAGKAKSSQFKHSLE